MAQILDRVPVQVTSLLIVLFVAGLFVGAILRDGSSFRDVWIGSYLKMHSSLTRAATDDRLLVMHTDLAALQQLADQESAILSVNESGFSNVAYVVVEKADVDVLSRLRGLPSVQFVLRNRAVLFCH